MSIRVRVCTPVCFWDVSIYPGLYEIVEKAKGTQLADNSQD